MTDLFKTHTRPTKREQSLQLALQVAAWIAFEGGQVLSAKPSKATMH